MKSLLSHLPLEAFETLLDVAFDGIAIHEAGVMLYVNSRLADMYQYTVEELVGRRTHELAAADFRQTVQDSSRSDQERVYAGVGVRKDGQTIHVEIRSIPFHWQERMLKLTAMRDVSSQVALRETNEMFEATFEQAAVGITHTSPDGSWIRVNHRFGEMLGYPREELIRRSLSEFLHPEDLAGSSDAHARILSGEASSQSREARFLRRDGSVLWVQLHTALVRGQVDEPKYFVTIAQDISERKGAEEKLLDHRMQMFASSKMSALGEMAGGIVHEINNPLAIIRAYVGVLRENVEQGQTLPAQLLGSIEKIDATVLRITQIVRSLMGFARGSDNDPFQAVAVREIVADTLDLCKPRLRQGRIEVVHALSDPGLKIECRKVPISQLVLNLINNAADAVAESAQKWIRIEVSDPGEFVEIAVEDSGPGVPVEIRDRIMLPFFTTKVGRQGTGLGLSISKKIAESHSGSLELDRDCVHTRFVIRLPKQQPVC